MGIRGAAFTTCGEGRIRTSEGECRQIYSLLPLTAREPLLAKRGARRRFGGELNALFLSRRPDSNRRPADYKSAALPTELRRQYTVVGDPVSPSFTTTLPIAGPTCRHASTIYMRISKELNLQQAHSHLGVMPKCDTCLPETMLTSFPVDFIHYLAADNTAPKDRGFLGEISFFVKAFTPIGHDFC
jgi:hypothetical protein